jgi:hypothetical protein
MENQLKMRTPVRIVDLDSTVSDDVWRQWMIVPDEPDSNEKYHAYHVHCDRDYVINRHIVDESPVPVVFLTARPEYLRKKTTDWLAANKLKHLSLLMRSNSDHTPSPEMKKRALSSIARFHTVERAYDDRPDIVAMYRAQGIEGVLV